MKKWNATRTTAAATSPPGDTGLLYEATSSSTQTLTSGTTATVTGWAGTGNIPWSNLYANGVWTIAQAGLYLLNFTVAYATATSTTGSRGAFIFVNSSEVRRMVADAGNATSVIAVSTLVNLAAGDTVEFRAYQNSGVNGVALNSTPGHRMQSVRLHT